MKPRSYAPYAWSPIIRRPKFSWPNGAKIAVWLIPNIEYFALNEQIPASAGAAARHPTCPTGRCATMAIASACSA